MKPQFGLEQRPDLKQEVQLVCSCCGQAYSPDKAWEDRLRAIVFGAEEYANCPNCTQEVLEQVLHDAGYRQRSHDRFIKWRKMFEGDSNAKSPPRNTTTEPTYEELKAQVERLERQMHDRLQFKVSEKGGVSIYGLGRFPVTLYYERGCACCMRHKTSANSSNRANRISS